MKKCTLVLLSLLGAFLSGCKDHNLEPHTEDVMAWRAGGPQGDLGNRIAVDEEGNLYVTGNFNGTATFGSTTITRTGGTSSVFIVKYNNKGEVLWAQKAESSQNMQVLDIALDGNNNVYISGFFTNDVSFGSTTVTSPSTNMLVAKYNSSGDLQWIKYAGSYGPFTVASSIATDRQGNVYVAGHFTESITFGTTTFYSGGALDAFIVKYNTEGEVVWAQKVTSPQHVSATAVAVDESGNAYITGYFQDTATFGTTTLTGVTVRATRSNIFVAKYSPNGEALWAQRGSSGSGTVIAVDRSGNVYVTGSIYISEFTPDIHLAKYNTNGEIQWSRYIGTMGGTEGGADIAVDKSGNTYLVGTTNSSLVGVSPIPSLGVAGGGINLVHYGGDDIFVVKFDSNENVQWAKSAGGTGNDYGRGIAVDGHGTAYTTGFFSGTATFGNTTLTSAGGADIFVAKFK